MASVSHTRACATTPPAPQPQTPPAKDQDDDDDDALVLTRDQLQRLHAFRDALHRCASASERDRLCLALRDQLIDHEGGHEILVACAERLTAKACAEYFQWRVDMAGRPPTPLAVTFREDHVAPWDRFFGLASIGYAARLRCLDALTEVAHRWGRHVVLHYDLVLGGPEYCHHVRIAARVIPTFDKAVVALNRCTKERAATQPPSHPARDISSHIDVEDLQRITQWWENGTYPRKHLRDEDLPPGYGFDDFHLMVPLEHAWPPIKSASSSPVSWPATSLITPVPSIRESVKTAAAAAAPQWSPYRLVPIPREHTTLAPPKTKASASQSTQSSENPAGETRGHHPPPAPPMAADPRCVCPDDVPPMLLLALDIPTAFTPSFATKLTPFLGKLCRPHLQHFAEHTAAAMDVQPHITPTTAIETNATNPTTPAASAAQRTSSFGSVDEHRPKRQRVDDPIPHGTTPQGRALHDRDADEAYRKQVLTELRQKVEDTIFPRSTHGEGTNRLIQELLEKAEPPNTSRDKGAIEMLFCSGDQAEALVDFESPHGAPIVTDGQQQFRWKTRERPIAQFLRRMGNLDRFISVQIPSRSALSESFEVRKLSEVKSRYLADESTDDPWNILDLQSPLPSAILPNFLSGENCQLLLQVRDTVLMEESAERVVASSRQWNEWRNVLEWVLMSQGGHNTAPHTDSHGFSTWITAQEGRIGFGWLSDPTDKERAAWIANPGSYTGGRWRYTVLKPGQTVFFVSGTIHFVFRIRAPQTLALGGHVLQWSGLERWMAIVLTQMRNPSITNEDMGVSAAKYVGVVSRLVVAKVNEDRANGLEIEDRILRFLDSVKAFETAYGQLNKKKRRSPAGSKKRAR
ncbi:hypothetical protein VD0004_g341 [Verticillium dahliae]|nr:hypothetical protein VD0004_g341 [Verticillium dahliae]PNH77267.1 hypothetical protein VD0001_g343 [Verticillium dahliae]